MRNKTVYSLLLIVLLYCLDVRAETYYTTPVCERSTVMQYEIVQQLGKPCDKITRVDLLTIVTLDLYSPMHVGAFKSGDFSGLLNLSALHFKHTRIKELPEDIFYGLHNLRTLFLEYNPFTDLPSGLFRDQIYLENLTISGNNLIRIPDGIFQPLNNLKSLDISGNQITDLPKDSFLGLSNLSELFMYDNPISELPQGLFDPLNNLSKIVIGSNSLTYIPDEAFLKNHYIEHVGISNAPLNLTGPAAFKGVPLVEDLPSNFNVDPEFDWKGL